MEVTTSGMARGPSTWRKRRLGYPGDPVPGGNDVWDSQGTQYLEVTTSGIARGPVAGGNDVWDSQVAQFLEVTTSGIARGPVSGGNDVSDS